MSQNLEVRGRDLGLDRNDPDMDHFNEVAEMMFIYQMIGQGHSPQPSEGRWPWKMYPEWNYDTKQWTVRVEPGFLRAQDATVPRLNPFFASQDTWTREVDDKKVEFFNSKDDDFLDVPITEKPAIPIKPERWRIASGPEGHLESKESARPVPAYFTEQKDVKVQDLIKVDTTDGLATVETVQPEFNVNERALRQLRSLELYLRQPKPEPQLVEVDDPTLITRTRWEIQIRFKQPDQFPTALELRPDTPDEFTPPVTTAALAAVQAASANDYLWLGTLWMIGPPGDFTTQFPDETWEAYPVNYVYRNVDWTVDAAVNKIQPTRLVNPLGALGGGAGASIAQSIIDGLNQTNSDLEQQLNSVKIDTAFWTV